MPRRPSKTPEDLRRLKFSVTRSGDPVKIGGHESYGEVYVGRAYFNQLPVERELTQFRRRALQRRRAKGEEMSPDRGRYRGQRVAIKRFRANHKLDDRLAREYQTAIDKLYDANVPLPLMGMVKLPAGHKIGREVLTRPEWVQVMQLFGSSRGSKLTEQALMTYFGPAPARSEVVRIMTRAVNAGFSPHIDLVEPFKPNTPTKWLLPFDVDVFARKSKKPVHERARELVDYLRDVVNAHHVLQDVHLDNIQSAHSRKLEAYTKDIIHDSSSAAAEYARLSHIALKEAEPALKNALEAELRERPYEPPAKGP